MSRGFRVNFINFDKIDILILKLKIYPDIKRRASFNPSWLKKRGASAPLPYPLPSLLLKERAGC